MPRLSNASVRTKLLGAFGSVLVVLVLLSSAAYRTTALNQEATSAVVNTFQVIGSASALQVSLMDMESGYRGYLIAGDDAFLEPYRLGSLEFETRLAELKALTAGDSAQLERWRSIEEQARAWQQTITEPGIALRQEVSAGRAPPDELTRWVQTGDGQRRFADIRETFSEAFAFEEERLGQRQALAAEASERLQVVLVVGTVAAVSLAVVLALLLGADIVGPITRLATTAHEIAGGKLDRRIGLHRNDEIGVAAAAFDQMAERLQAIIRQSETILDTAAEGIVGLDQTGRVIFANPAAEQMVGLPEETLVAQSAVAWITPAAVESSAEPVTGSSPSPPIRRPTGGAGGDLMRIAFADAESGSVGAPGVAASPIRCTLDFGIVQGGVGELMREGDGKRLPIEYVCAPIRDAGSVVGAVLTFRDVTQRQENERALHDRARDLARSNADLEQFAYVASHDLQEPLRAVVSYLQLLERRYGSTFDDRARKYIHYAVDGGRRMQTLISDLLTFSRTGRRDLEVTPVDLEVVLEHVEAGLRVAIEDSGATITHDPLPTVHGDATQLAQLFQNLIGNAIKFRGEAAPLVHVSVERQNGAWQFSVRDNGIGIAPEYRERVFVLFQRLHGRDEYSGTGIGLAVCKKIVERHGGTLWVDETAGGGSTFRFTIPDPGDDPS